MKNVFWLIVGIGVGFVVAHLVSKNPSGKKFFDEIDGKSREFAAAIVEGYKGREAELRSVVIDTENAIADLGKKLK
ncbi:MAG: uncharacterized protein JWQ43_1357 [Glaciihabitans sp.]|nr:uncharacterized protein [Glaciihabitans sp.]